MEKEGKNGHGDRRQVACKIPKRNSREHRAQKEDMDTNFVLEVAGRLKKLSPRQNAYLKLQIQQLLVNVEFPQDIAEPTYQNEHHQY